MADFLTAPRGLGSGIGMNGHIGTNPGIPAGEQANFSRDRYSIPHPESLIMQLENEGAPRTDYARMKAELTKTNAFCAMIGTKPREITHTASPLEVIIGLVENLEAQTAMVRESSRRRAGRMREATYNVGTMVERNDARTFSYESRQYNTGQIINLQADNPIEQYQNALRLIARDFLGQITDMALALCFRHATIENHLRLLLRAGSTQGIEEKIHNLVESIGTSITMGTFPLAVDTLNEMRASRGAGKFNTWVVPSRLSAALATSKRTHGGNDAQSAGTEQFDHKKLNALVGRRLTHVNTVSGRIFSFSPRHETAGINPLWCGRTRIDALVFFDHPEYQSKIDGHQPIRVANHRTRTFDEVGGPSNAYYVEFANAVFGTFDPALNDQQWRQMLPDALQPEGGNGPRHGYAEDQTTIYDVLCYAIAASMLDADQQGTTRRTKAAITQYMHHIHEKINVVTRNGSAQERLAKIGLALRHNLAPVPDDAVRFTYAMRDRLDQFHDNNFGLEDDHAALRTDYSVYTGTLADALHPSRLFVPAGGQIAANPVYILHQDNAFERVRNPELDNASNILTGTVNDRRVVFKLADGGDAPSLIHYLTTALHTADNYEALEEAGVPIIFARMGVIINATQWSAVLVASMDTPQDYPALLAVKNIFNGEQSNIHTATKHIARQSRMLPVSLRGDDLVILPDAVHHSPIRVGLDFCRELTNPYRYFMEQLGRNCSAPTSREENKNCVWRFVPAWESIRTKKQVSVTGFQISPDVAHTNQNQWLKATTSFDRVIYQGIANRNQNMLHEAYGGHTVGLEPDHETVLTTPYIQRMLRTPVYAERAPQYTDTEGGKICVYDSDSQRFGGKDPFMQVPDPMMRIIQGSPLTGVTQIGLGATGYYPPLA